MDYTSMIVAIIIVVIMGISIKYLYNIHKRNIKINIRRRRRHYNIELSTIKEEAYYDIDDNMDYIINIYN